MVWASSISPVPLRGTYDRRYLITAPGAACHETLKLFVVSPDTRRFRTWPCSERKSLIRNKKIFLLFRNLAKNQNKSFTFKSCFFTGQRKTVSFVKLRKDVDFVGGDWKKMGKNGCGGITWHYQGNIVSSDIFSLAETHKVRQNGSSRSCPSSTEASGGNLRETEILWRKEACTQRNIFLELLLFKLSTEAKNLVHFEVDVR